MARQVILGADLAARRAARESHERPWVQSQTPFSSCIRNRPALQTSSSSSSSSSCIRNRPALQTTGESAVKAGKAQEIPPVAPSEPATVTGAVPASTLQPSSSKSRIPVRMAAPTSLPAEQASSSSTASVPALPAAPPVALPAALPVAVPAAIPVALPVAVPVAVPAALPAPPPQLRSALRRPGTQSAKTVSWGFQTEWATYTKGMKTKLYGREHLPAYIEEGDDEDETGAA